MEKGIGRIWRVWEREGKGWDGKGRAGEIGLKGWGIKGKGKGWEREGKERGMGKE